MMVLSGTNSAAASSSNEDEVALDAVTYISLALALPCLVVTVIVLAVFKRERTVGESIIMHLAGNLAVAFVVYVFGVEATNDTGTCTAMAVLLHFFVLVAFAWMLADSVYVYMSVAQRPWDQKFWWYALVAYGVPAVVVAVTGAVQGDEGYGYDDACWLNPADSSIWAFIGPAMVMGVTSLVAHMLALHGASSGTEEKEKAPPRAVKLSAGIFVLFVATWVFGVVAITDESALEYLFVLGYVLLGAAILICHCWLNRNVRGTVCRGSKESLSDSEMASRKEFGAAVVGNVAGDDDVSQVRE